MIFKFYMYSAVTLHHLRLLSNLLTSYTIHINRIHNSFSLVCCFRPTVIVWTRRFFYQQLTAVVELNKQLIQYLLFVTELSGCVFALGAVAYCFEYVSEFKIN